MKMTPTPFVVWYSGQGDIASQLRASGKLVYDQFKAAPNLIVVVLPEGGNEIYTAVKQ